MEDSLIITYDSCPPDVPTLIVARKDKYDMTMLNKFQDKDAFGIYHLLTGDGTIEWNKGINETIFQLKCIKEHLKFVSQTTDKSVDFDIKVLDWCISEVEKWIV